MINNSSKSRAEAQTQHLNSENTIYSTDSVNMPNLVITEMQPFPMLSPKREVDSDGELIVPAAEREEIVSEHSIIMRAVPVLNEHPRVIIEPSRIVQVPTESLAEYRICDLPRNGEARQTNGCRDTNGRYREGDQLRFLDTDDEEISQRYREIDTLREERRFRETNGCREEQMRFREQQRVAIELCRPGLQVVALPPEERREVKEFRAPHTPQVSSTSTGVIAHCPMRPPPPPPPKPPRHNVERTAPHEEPSSSIPDLEFDGTTVLCRVCGDKASGFHYGVHSCEGCKGFFRRSIQQKIQYRPCTKNQQCSILRINRNRCQYCRLKKCIAVGMSRDAVRFGRVPKREKARILAAMQQSSSSRSQERAAAQELDDEPRLLSRVVRAHVDTCEFTRDRVAAMRARARDCPSYSMPTLACPLNPAPELQSEKEFSQRFAHVIRGVIDFAGLIPGFQLLTQDDKFTLLKSGLFDALFIRLICMFDAPSDGIICLNGQFMKRDSIQNGANARFLVDSTFKFAERINSMCLTDAEVGLFCAIVLITPDRPGLRNIELVERMHTKLKSCLQSVINQNRPGQPEFLHELMKTLPDLRTLSTLHTEKLVVFRTEHKELLRQQMWTVEDESGKSPAGSSSWSSGSDVTMDEAVKSPLGSVSSTESMCSGEADRFAGAPLLAATLAGARCPVRPRADSGGSRGSASSGDDEPAAAGGAGLTVIPIGRPAHINPHTHPHLRYRKLDSPTDSGIESGNEKHEKRPGTSSGCSSPRSSLEERSDDRPRPVDDMPVLKRVLQAPPLYDTSSLMDEAYKPHKKFRAMRQRDSAEAESVGQSRQCPMTGRPSQLQMHLSRATPSLSSTHSVLARSLMEGPRMTPEQMKRTDIIQNYIMRGESASRDTAAFRTRWAAAPPAPSALSPPTPSRLELQVDIADSPQPLNLSKKSPSPPHTPYRPRKLLLEA